jgi:retron-type reverse transcriptase
VQHFERYLEDNIFTLHEELRAQRYRHGSYHIFHIHDPKHRVISKASVRDRLVHHAVWRGLSGIFEPTFIFHSYASRPERGTHLAVENLSRALRKVSRNYTQPCYVLKCDIRKFFDSVNHQKLLALIENKISDTSLLWLLREVLCSFTVRTKSPPPLSLSLSLSLSAFRPAS